MAKLRLFPTRNTSARAAAHRAMARAALFSDMSASTRLKRYNHHMEKARALEAPRELPENSRRVLASWLDGVDYTTSAQDAGEVQS